MCSARVTNFAKFGRMHVIVDVLRIEASIGVAFVVKCLYSNKLVDKACMVHSFSRFQFWRCNNCIGNYLTRDTKPFYNNCEHWDRRKYTTLFH